MTGAVLPRAALRARFDFVTPPVLRTVSLAVALALWEVFGRTAPIFASYPSAVVRALWRNAVVDNRLLPAFAVTFKALAVGYLIAAIGGIAVGYAMARNRLTRTVLDPYVAALYSTPRITLIPLVILLIGIGFELRVTMCVLSAIFPIIINTESGVRSVSVELLETAASFNVKRWTLLRTVTLPGSLPSIFVGLRVGVIRALVGVIVAEMTAGAAGIGYLLLTFGRFFQSDKLLGPVILLGLISILLTKGVTMIERRVTPWRAFE